MTLAAQADLRSRIEPKTGVFAPVSLVSEWSNAIDAGGVATQDAATITTPGATITGATHRILRRKTGTLLVIALLYDPALTAITAPKVKVFGRVSSQKDNGVPPGKVSRWELLKNKNGDLQTTLTPAASDAQANGLAMTTVDLTNHAVDMQGCDEFLIGVETALAGSTGVTTSAVVLARSI